jgi:hypothetical protein
MNISSGGLSFDFTATNDDLKRVIEDSKRDIQGLSDSAKAGGKLMDAAFKQAFDRLADNADKVSATLSEQRQAIKGLETDIAGLRQQADKAFANGDVAQSSAIMGIVSAKEREIAKRKEAVAACYEALDALDAERTRLEKLQESYGQSATAVESLRTQLRRCKEQLATMEANGGEAVRQTEEFRALQEEAGRLADALADAQSQVAVFSDDNAAITGAITGLSGLAGAFSAAQGVMSMFGTENEELQKSMMKVQSLIAVTTGLQQVANAVNKDSSFMLVTVRRMQDALAASSTRLAAALGISTAAAKALIATLTVGASVAITALLLAFEKMISKQAEAKKAADEFNKAVASEASKSINAFKSLQAEWLNLTNSLKDREKWVQDNADKFEDLGFKVRNAKEAEELLVNNAKAFAEACTLKAKALAMQNLAAEKYQEIIKKQLEVEAMPDKVYAVDNPNSYNPNQKLKLVDNEEKAKAAQELKDMENEAAEMIKKQLAFSEQEQAILSTIGRQAGEVVEGSVNAAKQELQRLQSLYDDAASQTERTKLAKQIAAQQAVIDSMNTKTGNTETKTFNDQLTAKKALYQQYIAWVTSSDETVRQAAATEFKGLLDEGRTYLEYLEGQRASISAKTNKTADDLQHLQLLNNAIAQETKDAVTKDFDAKLQEELDACQTLAAKLDVLAQRRKEIASDDPTAGEKNDIIDKAETDVTAKVKDYITELLDGAATVEQRQDDLRANQLRNLQLLTRAAANATNEESRTRIQKAIETYRQLYALGLDNIQDLEQINEDALRRYGTYEQKRLMIVKDYEQQIAAARLAGNEQAARRLEGERDLEILKETQAYTQLFNDVGEISIKTATAARNSIISVLKSLLAEGKITAEQYKAMIADIDTKLSEVAKGKTWTAMLGDNAGGGFMDLIFGSGDFETKLQNFKSIFTKSAADADSMQDATEGISENMTEAGEGAVSALGMVDAIITAVYQTLQAVSSTLSTIADYQDSIGKSDSADTLRDWADCINAVNETAMSGWENLKNGNVMGAISDTISMPFKLMTVLNKIHDKKYTKSIQEHERAVTKLKNAYNALEDAVNRALGEEVYTNQTALINNLKKQQAEISGMISDEQKKKNSDADKIEEYREEYAELGRQIKDIMDEITESITQTTATDLASSLADALVDAFEAGEDAAQAFGDVANDVIKNAVVNALKLQLLEQPLQAAIKQLQADMGFDEYGNGTFDGLTTEEQARFKQAVEAAGENFQAAMEIYKDLFEELDENDPTTLSGAIKGASQESIDLLAGQTNAVRQNQVTSLAVMRDQLQRLSNIDANVAVISTRMLSILNAMNNAQSSGLRSQGITD